MIISLIAAMGKNRVIGKNNQMMWHLPLEYKYFKETTLGHHIVMGRKNYEAIGRALPGRPNLVITRDKKLKIKDSQVFNSLESAINFAKSAGETELFITGGGEIYKMALPLADRIYLTEIDYSEEGDVYFPEFNQDNFTKKLIHSERVHEKNTLHWNSYLFEKITE